MNYVFSVPEADLPALIEYYQEFSVPSTPEHILYLFQSSAITVTIFRSGKVMLQGPLAKQDYLMWSEIFGFKPLLPTEPKPAAIPQADLELSKIKAIGSDEVGTGDFYGPVVVCAAFAQPADYEFLLALGVRDSKKLTDEAIIKIAAKITPKISHQLLVTDNVKYNELIDKGYNMNKIKAYLHNHAIRKLALKHDHEFEVAIVDEFCSKENYFKYLEGTIHYDNIRFVQKAEDKHLSVAVASIIARAAFLEKMDQLSQSIGIVLPLGASVAVDVIGKRIALEKGFGIFREIAKLHFKNMDKIKEMM